MDKRKIHDHACGPCMAVCISLLVFFMLNSSFLQKNVVLVLEPMSLRLTIMKVRFCLHIMM